MITHRMYQVKYDASLRTVLSTFRFTLWGPAPHHSLKNRIFFWLPARWASGFSGDYQQDHQCLWLLLCYSFILPFIACILLGIKLLLLLLRPVLNDFVMTMHGVTCEQDILIDQSHNAPVPYPAMQSAEQKYVHFCSERCIMEHGTDAFCDQWDWSIKPVAMQKIMPLPKSTQSCHNLNLPTMRLLTIFAIGIVGLLWFIVSGYAWNKL